MREPAPIIRRASTNGRTSRGSAACGARSRLPGRTDGRRPLPCPGRVCACCATATAGYAIARRFAAGRAAKGRRPTAAAAACIRAIPRAACGRSAGGSSWPARARRLAACSFRLVPTGATASFDRGRLPSSTRSYWSATVATPNCGACHAAASQNVAGWATSLVIAHDDQPTQSQLCMNCHAKTISKEHALAAHNLPANLLEQVSASRGVGKMSASREVACATCHREHHGAQFNLTAIENAACQSCHQQRFASFASDHPDFGNWPYERRTRIAFNHASHSGKYFAEKKQKFDCRACHVSDATDRVEQLASYETACASCHDEKIATSVGRGLPMLALPTLDVDALTKCWPQHRRLA